MRDTESRPFGPTLATSGLRPGLVLLLPDAAQRTGRFEPDAEVGVLGKS